MKTKCYLVATDNILHSECYTTLVDACNSLGVSYRMAMQGKRVFKDRVIIDADIIQSDKLIIKGRDIYKTRQRNVGNNN